MKNRIVNLNTAVVEPLPAAMAPQGPAKDRYDPRVAMVGALAGAAKLGFNLIALSPGKRAFPFHSHRTNEEAFLVLSGRGEVRLGGERRAIVAGDLICAPAGGPETAHQIINSSDEELRYLAIGTRETPDVIEYPDTGKFRVLDVPRGEDQGFDAHRGTGPSVGYWDGE